MVWRFLIPNSGLNKDLKLSMRKSCRILQEMFGIELSAGGLAQALERVATSLQGAYDQNLETLHQSQVIHTDETGWWVGGPGYTLWVFTNQETTYYRVVKHRDRATAKAILSADFQGVLVSDCLSIYDGLDGVQQKCYAHHLKALSKALRTEAGQGSSYLLELRSGSMSPLQANHAIEVSTAMRQDLWHVVFSPLCP
jgi:transposase